MQGEQRQKADAGAGDERDHQPGRQKPGAIRWQDQLQQMAQRLNRWPPEIYLQRVNGPREWRMSIHHLCNPQVRV